jgi:hypothetical protein
LALDPKFFKPKISLLEPFEGAPLPEGGDQRTAAVSQGTCMPATARQGSPRIELEGTNWAIDFQKDIKDLVNNTILRTIRFWEVAQLFEKQILLLTKSKK